ncbi:uncharacterized protein VNE69_06081 [Vairimorpha necatrix]|uniref:Uncharacterized protein n=1 Tax=Vairimorpha necatrix TaxID=6039 RepID=A0AAX4JCS1_9MICR
MKNEILSCLGLFIAGLYTHLCLILYLNGKKLNEIFFIHTNKEDNEQLVDEIIVNQPENVSIRNDELLEISMNAYTRMYKNVKNNNNLQYSINNGSLTVVCTNEGEDKLFLINLLSEYHKTSRFFIPQNNLITSLIKKSVRPKEEYVQPFFKMSSVKIIHWICTFLYVHKEYTQLSYICTPDFQYIEPKTMENLEFYKKSAKNNPAKLSLIAWIDVMYHPIEIKRFFQLRFKRRYDKKNYLLDITLKNLDEKILLTDSTGVMEMSILDYLLATHLLSDPNFKEDE